MAALDDNSFMILFIRQRTKADFNRKRQIYFQWRVNRNLFMTSQLYFVMKLDILLKRNYFYTFKCGLFFLPVN